MTRPGLRRGPAFVAAVAIGFLAFGAGVAGVAAADPGAISIVDRSFQPADLTIHVGDTVTWTVTKAITDAHSVTSGTPGGADSGKAFDSGIKLRNNGDTFPQTFSTAGTFAYYCVVHPADMHGTILVLAPGQSAPPPASAAPAASTAPGSGGAAERGPVSTNDKLIAAGILGATLVVLFGAASFYRRMNG